MGVPPFTYFRGGTGDLDRLTSLLKGESIDFTWKSLNLSLDHWGPGLEDLLDGCARSVLIEQDMRLDMEGVRIPIGRVRTHIEEARLADPETVQRALLSGSVSHLRLLPGASDKATTSRGVVTGRFFPTGTDRLRVVQQESLVSQCVGRL